VTISLCVVLRCADGLLPKVRYVFDTLLMAAGVAVSYSDAAPATGPWIFYGARKPEGPPLERCLAVAHCPQAWTVFSRGVAAEPSGADPGVGGIPRVFAEVQANFVEPDDIAFDLVANAFYFLASWEERIRPGGSAARALYTDCAQHRLRVPQDIVDRYMDRLLQGIDSLAIGVGDGDVRSAHRWPGDSRFAVVLSHDVDFVPAGFVDNAKQGGKTFLRHLVRERKPIDAARTATGLLKAFLARRDPYGCVPQILARETSLGVRASYQVAVGHRHPNDVNYRIEDDATRDYLHAICDAGFDLCLHGSVRSTENPDWYVQEAALLGERLSRPLGSRQHYLSFDYDGLFSAQERAGIQYDMSMGFPDRTGPRAGFSYPYFPYCVEEDRPYDVVQISLFLMDVTLRSYLGLDVSRADGVIANTLSELQRKQGCASVVWHPIVFGGARDPGYDDLYWRLVDRVLQNGGLATDGKTINDFWRRRASGYPSFSFLAPCAGD
jgi:hypothetical protein